MSLEPDRMSNTMPNAANGFSYVQSRIGVIRIRAPSRADGRARRKRERERERGGRGEMEETTARNAARVADKRRRFVKRCAG